MWVDRFTLVCIVCRKHGEFFQTYDIHFTKKSGCKFCSREQYKKVLFSEEELSLLRKFYPSSLSRNELLAYFPNRTWRSLLGKAMQLGLPSDRKYKRPDKLGHLLALTVENAYLWGLIYADGYLSEQVGLNISLWKQDEDYLLRIGERFGLGGTQNANAAGSMRRLKVQDAARIRELKQLLDYHEKKTYNPPTHFRFLATPEMRLAFFIGLIDGDGSVQFAVNGNFRCIRVIMHHNWLPFLSKFCSQLSLDTEIEFTVKENSRSNAYLYMGRMANYEYLLKFIQSQQLPVLDRKWPSSARSARAIKGT